MTIRYSAEAGLRPFYLTVANRIKDAHPDALLEKRILPPVSGEEAVFEIVVDGKTVIGKKKTKMLKVPSRGSRKGGDSDSKGDPDDGDGAAAPGGADIASGRSVFVSMEKLDQELAKARRRRRPNTAYKSREDALRGAMDRDAGSGYAVTRKEEEGSGGNNVAVSGRSTEMTEAVMRLERLKAMSTRRKGYADV